MVRKLMKHELRAILRVLMWFMLAVLLVSVLARVVFELVGRYDISLLPDEALPQENISMMLGTMFSAMSVGVFWFLSVTALLAAGTVMCLVRFFKSLFTGEGYMTFSLPVTPTKLLIAKFLSAFIVTVCCWCEVILSVFIVLPTNTLIPAMGTLFNVYLPYLFAFLASSPLLCVEAILLLLVLIPVGLVYLFLIASIGQLFTKGRVIITIALYYGVSFLLGNLLSFLLIPVLQLGMISEHLILWVAIVLIAAFDVGGFFVIRYLLSRKVNLVV